MFRIRQFDLVGVWKLRGARRCTRTARAAHGSADSAPPGRRQVPPTRLRTSRGTHSGPA